MTQVTPPPMARLPNNLQPELANYLKQINRILLQMWTRTGGAEDLVDFSAEGEDNNNQIAYLVGQINDLREAIECIQCDSTTIDLKPLTERLRALETDIPVPVQLGSMGATYHLVNNLGEVSVDTTFNREDIHLQRYNIITATVSGLTITLPDLGSDEAMVLVQQSYSGTPPTVVRN